MMPTPATFEKKGRPASYDVLLKNYSDGRFDEKTILEIKLLANGIDVKGSVSVKISDLYGGWDRGDFLAFLAAIGEESDLPPLPSDADRASASRPQFYDVMVKNVKERPDSDIVNEWRLLARGIDLRPRATTRGYPSWTQQDFRDAILAVGESVDFVR